jgi:spermidine synthase
VDYTRTMMGALLFHPSPRAIGVIGLGGGSQVKFCHRHLRHSRIEVAEINPHVIALRRHFRVPDDDARLWVTRADGAVFVRERPGRYDVLLVDGYDESGIPEALSTRRFYEDCRNALAPHGVMASNLYTADVDRHVNRLRRCFGERVLVLEEEAQSNRVAFAWVGDPIPPGRIDVARVLAGFAPRARVQLEPVFTRLARALRGRSTPRGS